MIESILSIYIFMYECAKGDYLYTNYEHIIEWNDSITENFGNLKYS